MKMLVSAAVFGLLPVPPMDGTVSGRRDDPRVPSEDFDFSHVVFFSRVAAERLATKEVLADIRDALEKIRTDNAA